jgi:hypothetical protein
MENGNWKLENGNWRMENGTTWWHLTFQSQAENDKLISSSIF